MNPSDPLKMQRLVDGECDEAELRSLLVEAENQPDGWRQIATAFVEDKFWQMRFRQTGTSHDNSRLTPASKDEDHTEQQASPQKFAAPSNRTFHPRLIRWLTMAAGLMLAASFGYLLGTDQAQPNPELPMTTSRLETPEAPAAELATSQTPMPKITPASLKPDYHLQLPKAAGQSTGVAFDSEIPLYYVQSREQLDQLEKPDLQQFQLSPEILVQLTDRGIQMRQDVNFISGNLKDGRSFMIPVRTINFSPGQ